jgi:hypothetical protein
MKTARCRCRVFRSLEACKRYAVRTGRHMLIISAQNDHNNGRDYFAIPKSIDPVFSVNATCKAIGFRRLPVFEGEIVNFTI